MEEDAEGGRSQQALERYRCIHGEGPQVELGTADDAVCHSSVSALSLCCTTSPCRATANATSSSISLRSADSQDSILRELDQLKVHITRSLQVAIAPKDGFSYALGDHSNSRISRNLQSLARAAHRFHSTASTTASTIVDGIPLAPWTLSSDGTISESGELTPFRLERIQTFLRQNPSPPRQQSISSSSNTRAVSSTPPRRSESWHAEYNDVDEVEDDSHIELIYLNGLGECAVESFKDQDFAKAEAVFLKAIQRCTGSNSSDPGFRKLQSQLSVTYFFQGKFRLAQPIVESLAKSKRSRELDDDESDKSKKSQQLVICNLLHAISLAHLNTYSFDMAISACKRALNGKYNIVGSKHPEYFQTLGLLATIQDRIGEQMYAEVFWRLIPSSFSYKHPKTEVHYINEHPTLLKDLFGEGSRFTLQGAPAELYGDGEMVLGNNQPSEDIFKRPTLRSKARLEEKFCLDTSKEVCTIKMLAGSEFCAPDVVAEPDEESCAADETSTSTVSETLPTPPVVRIISRIRGIKRHAVRKPSINSISNSEGGSPKQARPKFGDWWWSKSDTNLLGIKKPKTFSTKRLSNDDMQRRWEPFGKRKQSFNVVKVEKKTVQAHVTVSELDDTSKINELNSPYSCRPTTIETDNAHCPSSRFSDNQTEEDPTKATTQSDALWRQLTGYWGEDKWLGETGAGLPSCGSDLGSLGCRRGSTDSTFLRRPVSSYSLCESYRCGSSPLEAVAASHTTVLPPHSSDVSLGRWKGSTDSTYLRRPVSLYSLSESYGCESYTSEVVATSHPTGLPSHSSDVRSLGYWGKRTESTSLRRPVSMCPQTDQLFQTPIPALAPRRKTRKVKLIEPFWEHGEPRNVPQLSNDGTQKPTGLNRSQASSTRFKPYRPLPKISNNLGDSGYWSSSESSAKSWLSGEDENLGVQGREELELGLRAEITDGFEKNGDRD